MESILNTMNYQINKQFKTYKQKVIAKQLFNLIVYQFNTIELNCKICSKPVVIELYVNHLV